MFLFIYVCLSSVCHVSWSDLCGSLYVSVETDRAHLQTWISFLNQNGGNSFFLSFLKLHLNREAVDPAAVDTSLPLTCFVGLIFVISDLEETRNVCIGSVCVCVQLQLTVVAEVVHQNDLIDEMNWGPV